jgi:hypothetical protein
MWERGFNSLSEENAKNKNKNKNNNKNNDVLDKNEKVEHDRPNAVNNNYDKTDNTSNTRNDRPNNRNDRPNTRNDRPNTRNDRPNTRNDRPNTRNDRPNTRNDRYNRNNNIYSRDRGSVKISNADTIKQLIKEGFLTSPTEENEEDDVKETSYLEHCKKEKEKDELKKSLLEPGWVSYIYNKGNIQCSRDGINYYDDINNSYSEDVKIEKERQEQEQEEYELSMRFCELIQELDRKYERESCDYYETYNELDMYAIARIERLKYEEYEKTYLIQNEKGCISDEDSENENLDD